MKRWQWILVMMLAGCAQADNEPPPSSPSVTAAPARATPLSDSDIQHLRRRSPESFVDTAAIWPRNRRPIPVCWESSVQGFDTEKRWVESAVKTIIEDESSVRFSGPRNGAPRWGVCQQYSLGVRISVADERPHSAVGQQWSGGGGRGTELPTPMTLNFALIGSFSPYCDTRREHCLQVTAVHEMLHAIGFLHEHLREDAPLTCREQFEHTPDIRGYKPVPVSTAYDAKSMMNYCVSIYRTPVKLSADDVQAIELFYRLQ